MREIKFRGQRTLTKQWVYGNLMIKREESPIPETTELYTQHYIVPISGLDYYEYEVDPSTVGQYTGLKDKNGKEIYEGDIVENGGYYNIIGVVCYDTEYAHYFILNEASGESMDFVEISSSEVEVIGNIHDNTELLKGGDK